VPYDSCLMIRCMLLLDIQLEGIVLTDHGSMPCIFTAYLHCVDSVIHEMDCMYHHESILS